LDGEFSRAIPGFHPFVFATIPRSEFTEREMEAIYFFKKECGL
jgi:hypothetical protein